MRKIVAVLGLLSLVCVSHFTAVAQQYPVFTQYYFNELVINPAYAGAHVELSLTAAYRNQWVNFPGAPKTTSISGHSSLYNGKMGVGMLVNNDQIGTATRTYMVTMLTRSAFRREHCQWDCPQDLTRSTSTSVNSIC